MGFSSLYVQKLKKKKKHNCKETHHLAKEFYIYTNNSINNHIRQTQTKYPKISKYNLHTDKT